MKKNSCIISGIDISLLPFMYNEDSRECQIIKNNLLNTIIELHKDGVDEFYTDCSFGFPLWGGEIVTGLMLYNDILLYVIYPYENQSYKYTANWQDRFNRVHERCTDVIPMYIDEDIDGNITFLQDEEQLQEKAIDYMLSDCGRLLFCGKPNGERIYAEAAKRSFDIMVLEI
jgi:uncharacterized phage-like protein YoqJ